jgi:hypothetical protein
MKATTAAAAAPAAKHIKTKPLTKISAIKNSRAITAQAQRIHSIQLFLSLVVALLHYNTG